MYKEIGGYIELDTYNLPILHNSAIALNCGRNCLAYLLKSRKITKIKLPFFICDSIINTCKKEHVSISFYHIGIDFRADENISLDDDEWLYLINYYGQMDNNEIQNYVDNYERVIVDQANGFFQQPLNKVDTIYTCRKWFGVADGAFLYTDSVLSQVIPIDESFERMHFLLGRFEKDAGTFYSEYVSNNKFFSDQPIKKMSKLTNNLLHAIDYQYVEKKRNENFKYLDEHLNSYNKLNLREANFMYPLLVDNGNFVRKRLIERKIYVPTLWPTVFEITNVGEQEYEMAENILPLPIDQRYGTEDMEVIVEEVLKVIR